MRKLNIKYIFTIWFFFVVYCLIISAPISAQTKIDSIVSIKFKGSPSYFDTSYNNTKIEYYLYTQGNDNFLLQKTKIDDKANILNSLPHDDNSIKQTYSSTITGIKKGLLELNFKLIDTTYYNKGDYKFCELKFGLEPDSIQYLSRIVMIEEFLYSAIHLNSDKINLEIGYEFLNSLQISNSIDYSQKLGESKEYKIGYLIGKYLIPFLVIIAILIFIAKRKNNKIEQKKWHYYLPISSKFENNLWLFSRNNRILTITKIDKKIISHEIIKLETKSNNYTSNSN